MKIVNICDEITVGVGAFLHFHLIRNLELDERTFYKNLTLKQSGNDSFKAHKIVWIQSLLE